MAEFFALFPCLTRGLAVSIPSESLEEAHYKFVIYRQIYLRTRQIQLSFTY